ncbi:MAG: choloylglycine hydrolase family protein [Flavobacteriales bacterium]|nr:choloylglycine hydrolase family protein [Flavobacteriales bacterium]
MKKMLFLALCLTFLNSYGQGCTGINITASTGEIFFSRTYEWGEGDMGNMLEIVPRNTTYTATTPEGQNGLSWKNQYGFVGMTSGTTPYINEGLNEKGLNVGMFFMLHYAQYPAFDPPQRGNTVSELELSRLLLSTCATCDDVRKKLEEIRITGVYQKELGSAPPIHWRVADRTGESLIIECTDGKVHLYPNQVNVLTNSPDYPWHIKNLNNYVNLNSNAAKTFTMGSVTVKPFGAGSGLLGLPGDYTPPSRFIRAAFFINNSRTPSSAYQAMTLCFTILANFDIPLSAEYDASSAPDIPSATQWTSVVNLTDGIFYYRTMYNYAIRRIELSKIDFNKTKDRFIPLDREKRQTILDVNDI